MFRLVVEGIASFAPTDQFKAGCHSQEHTLFYAHIAYFIVLGWQPRWFILDDGILSYYNSQDEVGKGCKGSIKMAVCDVLGMFVYGLWDISSH